MVSLRDNMLFYFPSLHLLFSLFSDLITNFLFDEIIKEIDRNACEYNGNILEYSLAFIEATELESIPQILFSKYVMQFLIIIFRNRNLWNKF